MIKKFIVSTAASLVLLGSNLAMADCPAYLNAEEGVPCVSEMTIDKATATVAAKTDVTATPENVQRKAIIESWMAMLHVE